MFDAMLTVLAIPVILLVVVILIVKKALQGRVGPSKDFTVKRRQFLTPREVDAFKLLAPIASAANLHVCPQASMDSFLKFEGEGGFRERGRYKARRSDFVLMDQKGDAVLVVEIDDASHRGREEKDAARDDVVLMAGIATLRVPGGRLPSSAQLKSMLADTCPRFFRR
jgi:hypothetical protein